MLLWLFRQTVKLVEELIGDSFTDARVDKISTLSPSRYTTVLLKYTPKWKIRYEISLQRAFKYFSILIERIFYLGETTKGQKGSSFDFVRFHTLYNFGLSHNIRDHFVITI